MSAASPVTRTTSRQQPVRQRKLGFILVGLLLLGMAFAYTTMFFGHVEGEEFSPDNFTRRSFAYYELPLLGLQISPIERRDQTNDLERYLITQQLVTEIRTTDDRRRWDLVVAARAGDPSTRQVLAQGDARILCSYLDATGPEKSSVWLEWSKEHPELAKLLWPLVAKLARQELYTFIPELLLGARGAKSSAALQPWMDGLLTEKYCEMAATQQQLGRHAAAVELFTEAIHHSPGKREAYSGRAASWLRLGQPDRATADLAAARGVDRKVEK